MEVVLGVITAVSVISQAIIVVFLVKYLADREERARESQEVMQLHLLEYLAKRDVQMAEERAAARQELQTLFNRIQAPEMAVAVTADVAPGTAEYVDEEREAELDEEVVSNGTP